MRLTKRQIARMEKRWDKAMKERKFGIAEQAAMDLREVINEAIKAKKITNDMVIYSQVKFPWESL